MGEQEKCPFTELPAEIIKSAEYVSFSIRYLDKNITYYFCWDFYRSLIGHENFIKSKKHIIAGLILKGKLGNNIIHSRETNRCKANENELFIEDLIEDYQIPKTPKEKYDNLLIELSKLPESDGQMIYETNNWFFDVLFWYRVYLKNQGELNFYFNALKKEKLIEFDYNTQYELIDNISLTYKGLSYLVDLEGEGQHSNKCFIAMAFNDKTENIRKAIKNALKETGYEPIIIDEQHVNSDQTINDAIIAGLKKCKFCIADFTMHRKGVYFESGFAVGAGKPVIYTCEEDDFKNAHFDIKPLQHIIYKTEDELQKKLKDKIEAWIDD